MIKAVVFDLGKVLLDFDYGIVCRRIAACGKLSSEEVRSFLMTTPLLLQYESGFVSSDEFHRQLCGSTGYTGAMEEFRTCFGDIFSPIEPMIDLQRTLRSRGYTTHIFSNTNDLAIRYIRNNFPFFANFDSYILSYEHGAMKPDPRLYRVVEHQTACRGDEILYIDDRPENIEIGAARHWHVILQESPQKTQTALHTLGLLP